VQPCSSHLFLLAPWVWHFPPCWAYLAQPCSSHLLFFSLVNLCPLRSSDASSSSDSCPWSSIIVKETSPTSGFQHEVTLSCSSWAPFKSVLAWDLMSRCIRSIFWSSNTPEFGHTLTTEKVLFIWQRTIVISNSSPYAATRAPVKSGVIWGSSASKLTSALAIASMEARSKFSNAGKPDVDGNVWCSS